MLWDLSMVAAAKMYCMTPAATAAEPQAASRVTEIGARESEDHNNGDATGGDWGWGTPREMEAADAALLQCEGPVCNFCPRCGAGRP